MIKQFMLLVAVGVTVKLIADKVTKEAGSEVLRP